MVKKSNKTVPNETIKGDVKDKKAYVLITMFQDIIEDIKIYRDESKAISQWEDVTNQKWSDFMENKIYEDEDKEGTTIFEVECVKDPVHLFVGVYGATIDHVEAFDNENDAIRRWEKYTSASWDQFIKDNNILVSTDFEDSNIYELSFEGCKCMKPSLNSIQAKGMSKTKANLKSHEKVEKVSINPKEKNRLKAELIQKAREDGYSITPNMVLKLINHAIEKNLSEAFLFDVIELAESLSSHQEKTHITSGSINTAMDMLDSEDKYKIQK